MKTKPISYTGILILVLLCNLLQAQNFGTYASAVWISNCNQSDFYNTTGTPANLIGPAANDFNNLNLGTYTQNEGKLILRGAQLKTFKNPASSNVCSARMYYRVYLQSGVGGAFTPVDLPLLEACDVPSSTFPSGGPCVDGDQKWQRIIPDGSTTPAPINLTTFGPGSYVLEVYYDIAGSNTSTSLCNETSTLNNSGNNYKAFFSIQSPTLNSTNPSSCFGSQGSITIGGLTPNTTYDLSYTDDGAPVGPLTLVTNGAGQLVLTGLNAGFYANFTLDINGCTSSLSIGQILSDPIFVPTFPAIPPFCAGTTAPTLPSSSTNGIAGTWSPATVSNTATGTYTFTPTGGQCAVPITRTITVTPRTTPTFPFGTSLIICGSGTVPVLPNNSTNGISGTWSPAVVDPNISAVYTFTPNPGQCANPTTFSVTVNPNIVPTFIFGTSISICSGETPPPLPPTSQNGIAGTWSPSTINNSTSGTYTFTPDAGQCAVPTSLNVTVNPIQTPTFSFGTSTSICTGSTAPILPPTSTNGVTGNWVPSVVDNQNSGTYVFLPATGQCAVSVSFTVNITPNITPSFSWGGGFTMCAGAGVPTLPSTSLNGITGSWNPTVVDDQNSGSYTFTPDAGQCAIPFTFAVTVNPNITPAFSFGTALILCSGTGAPPLPINSTNGIAGVWSPSTIDDLNSGTYTFTPNPGQCALPTTLTVTVNPIITPVFGIGSSLSICSGAGVPSLPTTSSNGVTGTWSPATIDNQNSAVYTFTPAAGQCAVVTSFTVTVNPNITPTFPFGTTLTICANGMVPNLDNNSLNGIAGTWSPVTVDNLNSGVYTFTPNAGQCAVNATFTVTVIQNVTPAFSFGGSVTICAGATAPGLPTTSTNGISGTWSPTTIDNQNSGTYTFTPNPGQCIIPPTVTLNVTITPNVTPTFSFGNLLTICAGGTVPLLPTTSDNGIPGTWNPAVVSTFLSGTYVFTPTAGVCALPFTYIVTVRPIVAPQFAIGTFQSVCIGTVPPGLLPTSTNGIAGTWSPSVVDNLATGTYAFTPSPGQCATPTAFIYEISSVPSTNTSTDITVTDGTVVPAFNFISTPAGAVVRWTNDNATIGLVKSGTGSVPSFTAVNENNFPVSGTVTATPMNNGCAGTTQTYKITVLPLDKDLFVPNVFSPNNDGKNDIFYVYGNYISKLEVQIFNQWGQHITTITNKTQGWDGKFKGSPQPVGVYVYVLKAEMTDKRVINLKGSITLVR